MKEMMLWYEKSAERWEESLPIGNGSLGAMILGGAEEEILGLNEESVWSGYYKDKNNAKAADCLEEVRSLVFSGKNKEAERLIQNNMLGEYNESYLPLGNLKLKFAYGSGKEGKAEGYRRQLDLENAVAQFPIPAMKCIISGSILQVILQKLYLSCSLRINRLWILRFPLYLSFASLSARRTGRCRSRAVVRSMWILPIFRRGKAPLSREQRECR